MCPCPIYVTSIGPSVMPFVLNNKPVTLLVLRSKPTNIDNSPIAVSSFHAFVGTVIHVTQKCLSRHHSGCHCLCWGWTNVRVTVIDQELADTHTHIHTYVKYSARIYLETIKACARVSELNWRRVLWADTLFICATNCAPSCTHTDV